MQLNILTFNWHEPYLCLLSRLGHHFSVVEPEMAPGQFRRWETRMRPLPRNVEIISPQQARQHLDEGRFDLVICHNVRDLLWTRDYALPRIMIFHNKLTTELALSAEPIDRQEYLNSIHSLLQGVQLVFISESKREDWGGKAGVVILPGIDVEEYGGYTGENAVVLRVANLLKERDLMLGYEAGCKILGDLPGVILGQNPALPESHLSRGFDDLLHHYRTCRVYLNATVDGYEDGYNLSMLEAMAAGMPVVSTSNATSPIINGINGFVSDDTDYLQKCLFDLLNYPDKAQQLGRRARQTVAEKFGLEPFLQKWREVIRHTVVSYLRDRGVALDGGSKLPFHEKPKKNVLLDYVSYPATTASYLERALRRKHNVVTCGAIITPEVRKMWNLEALKEEAAPQDIPRQPGGAIAGVLAALPENWHPDFYLWAETGLDTIPPDLESLDCLKACYLIDSHLNMERHIEIAKKFDVVFIAHRNFVRDFRAAGIQNVHWLPVACDPDIHGRVDTDKRHDVSFVGSITPSHVRRKRLLDTLAANFKLNMERKFLQDMAEIFSASRVVFNAAIKNDMNMRVFEALCSGSLLVTDEAPESGLLDLFRDREHLVIYRDENLVETVRHYLEHPEERERIAENGRREVLANHTYDHRIASMMSLLDECHRRLGAAESRDDGSKPDSYYRFVRLDVVPLIPESATCILEVGCAAGKTGDYLKRSRGVFYAGIELDPKAASEARQVLDDVIEGDIELMELPYAENSFDCIVCADVLEHLKDPLSAIRKLKACLKPDGVLVASIPNVQFLGVVHQLIEGAWTYQKEGILDSTHLRFFTWREIEKLFAEAEMDIVQVDETLAPEFKSLESSEQTTLKIGRMTLSGLSKEEFRRFFVFQYKIAVRQKTRLQVETWDKILLRAGKLEELKKFSEALELYKQVLEINPECADALSGMASCHMQREDFDRAEALFRQAVFGNPSSIKGWFGLGSLRVQRGEHERAMEAFHRVLEHDPSHHKALLGLGMAQWQMGQKKMAFKSFIKSLESDPDSARAMQIFLESGRELDELDTMERVLRKTLERHPANTRLLYELSNLLIQSQRWDEAAGNLERILMLDPEHHEARKTLGGIRKERVVSRS